MANRNEEDSFNKEFAVRTTIAMPQNPDVLNSLRRLGLNQYEAKAYFALATLGKSTAGELSARAELPRPRVYDVLSSLQDKGFVNRHTGPSARSGGDEYGVTVRGGINDRLDIRVGTTRRGDGASTPARRLRRRACAGRLRRNVSNGIVSGHGVGVLS